VLAYQAQMLGASPLVAAGGLTMPASIEPRFIYNQDFRSIYAITPGVLMLTMILIPAMLTALGIVREKEIGSITNLTLRPQARGLPDRQAGALCGAGHDQLCQSGDDDHPRAGVPLKGSLVALTIGAALFVLASTGLGMLISTLVRSQVAAIFATALICLVPSVNFSGLLYPVSTLVGGSYWVGVGFPSSWFQIVSLGTFTKGLGMDSFAQAYLALGGFGLAFITAARFMLEAGGMKRWLINVWLLGAKELRSVMKDTTLLVLIVFAFTAAVLIVSKGVKAEVSNATVALIDDDHSELSRRLADAIRRPISRPPWPFRGPMWQARWIRGARSS
jgi:hypothetical protein